MKWQGGKEHSLAFWIWNFCPMLCSDFPVRSLFEWGVIWIRVLRGRFKSWAHGIGPALLYPIGDKTEFCSSFPISSELSIMQLEWDELNYIYCIHFFVSKNLWNQLFEVHCIQYRVDCSSSAVFFPTSVFCCNFVPSVLNILLNTLLSYSLVLKLLYFIHFLELLQVYCYNPYLWISITLQGGDVLVSLLN